MTASTPQPVSTAPILAVTFVGTLGFSIVLPFLVFLVTRLGGNALVYGVMGATYSFFQLIGAPILGRWSDRYGRKRILLLSQLGTLSSWGIFLVALALPVHPLFGVESRLLGAFTITIPLAVLFFARALDGITGGNVSVANAYLADITEDADRSANFGKMAVASNVGFILGPAFAGILGTTAWRETLPVLAALLISAVASLMIALKLPDPAPCVLARDPSEHTVRKTFGQEQKECYTMAAARKLSVKELLTLPGIAVLLASQFFVYLAFNFYYIAFPVYAATGLNWSLRRVGIFFAVMSLMMATVQGPVLRRASKIWSDRLLVLGGAVVLATSFALFASRTNAMIFAGAALLAVGNGLMWPSLLAILSKATDRSVQGAVQGFAGSAAAVASIVGLIVGGFLYSLVGAKVFLVSAAMTALVFAVALGIPRGAPSAVTRRS
jgi:MFS transporter, DHA1 family, tetracycline resistance protein